MDDSKILDLYFARLEEAIFETDKKYGAFCRSIADAILRCDSDSEECVNDTYLRAWNVIPPQRPAVFSAFLGKITRNLSIDRLKRQTAAKRGSGVYDAALTELSECLSDGVNVEDSVDAMVLTEVLDRFLGSLSQKKRVIFVRRYWYFRTVAEISSELGIGESSVKMILQRERARLKTMLLSEGIEI